MSQLSSCPRKSKFIAVLIAILVLSGLCIFAFLVAAATFELQTSWFQARFFSSKADHAKYSVEAGANPDARFPDGGPYDTRLGYSQLGSMIEKAKDAGFEVESQARVSSDFQALTDSGFFG